MGDASTTHRTADGSEHPPTSSLAGHDSRICAASTRSSLGNCEPASKRRKVELEDSSGVTPEQPHSFGHSVNGGSSRNHFGHQYICGDVTFNQAQERHGPLAELSSSGAVLEALKFEEMDVRYATVRAAHAKTCRWLFGKQEYIDWRDPDLRSQNGGFLWIKGKPGSGKSTLMKCAVDDASKRWPEHHIIHFFFNARGSVVERSSAGMYRSLLVQLLEKVPRLQDVLTSLNVPRLQPQNWPLETFKNLILQLICNLGEEKAVCYIDALDECDENEVRDMVEFFEALGETTTEAKLNFHVCFSSRHYPNITIDKKVELDLDVQKEHDQDIRDYVKGKLKVNNTKLRAELAQSIQDRAFGVFLWVVLVVLILNKDDGKGHAHKLRSRLDQIPSGLEELFADVLKRGIEEDPYLVLTLQWILFAKRPLRLQELYAVAVDTVDNGRATPMDTREIDADDMKRFVLNSSKGLAEPTKGKTPTVQFIHESVREFLLATGLQSLVPDCHDLMVSTQKRLAMCCMQYISLDVIEALDIGVFMCKHPKARDKANSEEAQDLRSHAKRNFPFLEYSIDSIFHHMNDAYAKEAVSIEPDTSALLRHWVTLHNLVERYQTRRYADNISGACLFTAKRAHGLLRRHLETVNVARELNLRTRSGSVMFEKPLAVAIKHGDLISAQLLVDHGSDGQNLGQLLDSEATEGNFEAVKILLKAGAATRNLSQAALGRIFKEDQREIVDTLLTQWVVKRPSNYVFGCIFEASCEADNTHALSGILKTWSKVEPYRTWSQPILGGAGSLLSQQWTPFYLGVRTACEFGSENVLRMLLSAQDRTLESPCEQRVFAAGFKIAREAAHGSFIRLALEWPTLRPFLREECRRILSAQIKADDHTLARLLVDTKGQESPTGTRLVADELQLAIAAENMSSVDALLEVLRDFQIAVTVASRLGRDDDHIQLRGALAQDGVLVKVLDFDSMPDVIGEIRTTSNIRIRVNINDVRR